VQKCPCVVIIHRMHIFSSYIITNKKAIATWGKKRKGWSRLGVPYNYVHGKPWTHNLTVLLAARQRETITTTRWWSTSNRFPWDPTVRIVCVVGVGLVTTTTPIQQARSWRLVQLVATFAQIYTFPWYKPLHNGTEKHKCRN